MNQDKIDVMQSNDENSLVILHLNSRLDDYVKQNHELQAKIDSTTELIDWYIEHYTKLGHNDTVRKSKEIRVDMVNAEEFGNDKRIRGT